MNAIVTRSFSTEALSWAKEAFDYIKPAAVRTFAPISCAISILSCIKHLSPSLLYDDEAGADLENIIVDRKEDLIDIQSLVLSKSFTFTGRFKERVSLLEKVAESLEKSFLFNYQTVQEFNEKLGLNAKLCYSVEYFGEPVEAVGGTKSWAAPLIAIHIPHFLVDSNKTLKILKQIFTQAKDDFNKEEKKFVLAHEFMHIQHNDPLLLSGLQFTASMLNVMAWTSAGSSNWLSYFAEGALKAFGVELMAEVAISFYARYLENRADQKAMDLCQTNQGALAFLTRNLAFETHGHRHPHPKERLEKAKAWQPQKAA